MKVQFHFVELFDKIYCNRPPEVVIVFVSKVTAVLGKIPLRGGKITF